MPAATLGRWLVLCGLALHVAFHGNSALAQRMESRVRSNGRVDSAAAPYLATAKGSNSRRRQSSRSTRRQSSSSSQQRSSRSSRSSTISKTSRKSPDFDFPPVFDNGFLDHGLAVVQGLPEVFDPERMCGKHSDSQSWFEEVTVLEDQLRNGDRSKYWDMCYAVECSVNVGPPHPEAIINRAKLLDRINDLTECIATLEYGMKVDPNSPKMMERLADALMKFATEGNGNAAPTKHMREARAEGAKLYMKLTSMRVEDLEKAQHCFELSSVRRHMQSKSGEIECLRRAVALERNNSGYGNTLLAAAMAYSVAEIEKLHKEFGSASRNYQLHSEAPKDLPLQPIHEWFAGYPGALEASRYTTTGLLGSDYAPGRGGSDKGKPFEDWFGDSPLQEILDTSGVLFTETKARLRALMEPEQPEICKRVDKLCATGHAEMLYSLASPADSRAHESAKDKTGKSTLNFGSITPELLGVEGSPFGSEWSVKPWPKFPLYMVNTIRSICDCADLECDLAGKTWVMDPDAVREAIEATNLHVWKFVNSQDKLGYTPAHLALMNNDALTFAVLLQTDALDFSAEDAWGHSVVQMLYFLTPTREAFAMHDAASKYLQARGGPALPPLLKARQLDKFPGMDAAEGWDPTSRTTSWEPLSEWDGTDKIDDVDASEVSWADIVDKYISVGRPVVIKGALRDCVEEMKLWGKENVQNSRLSNVTFRAFSGEQSTMATLTEFIDEYFSTGELTDESLPRYIFAQQSSTVMEGHMKRVTEVDFITNMLKCIPYEIQEYFALAPPELPGAWSHYTLSMGGAGSGASMHMHEAAINFVIYGTRKWFVHPPTHASYTNQPMFQWLRDVYPQLSETQKPIEFLQESGDVVYLPAWWGHGTISVGDTLGYFKVPSSKLRESFNGPNPTGPLYNNFEPEYKHRSKWADRSLKHSRLASASQ